MKIKKSIDETVIYQTKNGAISLKQDASADMLWASQNHIADIFEIERSVVTKHIRNILKNKELDENSVRAKLAHTAEDGKSYQVQFYSLDVILAVGYRTNSKKAIAFRQWATKTLKDHIHKGFTINRTRLQKNYTDFLKAVDDVKALLPAGANIDNSSVLELVTLFADTWFSLDAYDKDNLATQGVRKKIVVLTAEKLHQALAELKQNLIAKGEATDIFGIERTKDSIAGIVGNVMQSFSGEDLYPSVEEKGSPPALTAITLLIAESSPKNKEKMTGLVCMLLSKRKSSKS